MRSSSWSVVSNGRRVGNASATSGARPIRRIWRSSRRPVSLSRTRSKIAGGFEHHTPRGAELSGVVNLFAGGLIAVKAKPEWVANHRGFNCRIVQR